MIDTVSDRPRAFLDISIGNEPAGRLVIELFADKTPKTCENFLALCSGSSPSLRYMLSPFHRIIKTFMVQGGDITKGDGTGGDSIYGGEFEDENLGWRDVDAAGLVCMANRGKGTNSSQFFITLDECPHLNNKHTIFGRVVSGDETLSRMADVEVDKNDRPLEPVLIARCGELQRRVKEPKASSSSTTSKDRGRQRPRRSSSRSAGPSRPAQRSGLEKRRPSDLVVDENLRGRPKRRSESGSRSVSRAIDSASASPNPKHKRKRSKSPSRGKGDDRETREGSPQYRRRRRSLPNQYHGDDQSRGHRDGGRSGGRDDRDNDRDEDREYGRRGGDNTRHDTRADRYRGRSDRHERDNYHHNSGDNYRSRDGRLEDGRLGDPFGDSSQNEGGIVFKGRGSMKYREPDRRW